MSKIVIFDVDGTIFDTKAGIIKALNEVYRSYALPEIKKDDEDKYIGPPVRDSFIRYGLLNEESAMEATSRYRKIYVEKYIVESKPYPGMVEVLKELKDAGWDICIASMKTMTQLKALLKNFEWNGFSYVLGADEGGGISKAMMLQTIKKKYCDIEQIYMVGDTEGDYRAAETADIEFIGVGYGYGDLSWLSPDRLIDKPEELIGQLQEKIMNL